MQTFRSFIAEIAGYEMTCTSLAGILGMSRAESCRRWLNGDKFPSEEYQKKISDVFGYPYERLRTYIHILKQPEEVRDIFWEAYKKKYES